ncbi:hypothetical protein [Bacillus phage vB_BceM_Bc431v3]|uniref:Uncharacterized protein n=1 Tax=Bacillus phage vB_BceM_Bc431v3 TaxID=1195072 RepID=M4HNM8_9CAUD|nr:hypothetical protein K201_gp088 [Bacillus phage vB_BceM_Bc431v3]AFQ96396.1 hypothetical protein [Bacillus phage vB_BceM_Bc431v3]
MTKSIENLFEVATRTKMLFPFRGMINVIDLWDLTPNQLDLVFKSLNAQFKQASEESLLKVKTPADKVVEVQIEIVKYIVSVKVAEQEARLQAQARKEEKQKLLSILATKEDEELQGKSAEEIRAMIADLDK